MPDTPRIKVRYRVAAQGEIPDGRLVDIRDRPGGQTEIRLDPLHTRRLLSDQFTSLSGHQIVHGSWRQRWTNDGRMMRPAQGLMLAVSRWETVPANDLPDGQVVFGVAWKGTCIWLVSEDYCTGQLRDAMNDQLLRLAGDGLWIQVWFHRRPVPTPCGSVPPLVAPRAPLLTV